MKSVIAGIGQSLHASQLSPAPHLSSDSVLSSGQCCQLIRKFIITIITTFGLRSLHGVAGGCLRGRQSSVESVKRG